MKILFTALLIITSLLVNGQGKFVRELLSTIDNQWNLDEENNLVYDTIVYFNEIENIEITNRLQIYFVEKYLFQEVLQSKQDGAYVIGKAVWPILHEAKYPSSIVELSPVHIIRLDLKENRLRLKITIPGYESESYFLRTPNERKQNYYPIKDYYPITKQGDARAFAQVFVATHYKAKKTIVEITTFILNQENNQDW